MEARHLLENLPTKTITRRTEVRRVPVETGVDVPSEEIRVRQELPKTPEISLGRKIVAALVQLGLVIAIGLGTYKVATGLFESAPKAERKARERVARLVEVETVRAATQGPVIEAWGEVQAAQTLIVRSEITGTITSVHPELTAGGRLSAGDVAVQMDGRDLQLAVGQAEAEIAGIQARILIEEGQAEIGKRELSRLSRNLTATQRSLVLREPQMAQLKAELAAAEAALDQARNAVGKTDVLVPFDSVVISQSIAPGAVVAQGAEAAQLVASDRFNVVLAVPAAALDWIDLEAGQLVRITQDGAWSKGQERFGQIVRLSSALSETGRMAELIAEVPDPLALGAANSGKPPLLLGSFVNVSLSGRTVEGAVSLNRAYLRDNDTVWVMSTEDKLEVRNVEVAWRGAETVLVRSGLSDGERIVTTGLSSVSEGMALRTKSEVSG